MGKQINEQQIPCQKHHDQVLSYYCEQEDEYVCQKCQEKHKGHKIFNIKEGQNKIMKPWKDLKILIIKVKQQIEAESKYISSGDVATFQIRINKFMKKYEQLKQLEQPMKFHKLKKQALKVDKYKQKILTYGQQLLTNAHKEEEKLQSLLPQKSKSIQEQRKDVVTKPKDIIYEKQQNDQMHMIGLSKQMNAMENDLLNYIKPMQAEIKELKQHIISLNNKLDSFMNFKPIENKFETEMIEIVSQCDSLKQRLSKNKKFQEEVEESSDHEFIIEDKKKKDKKKKDKEKKKKDIKKSKKDKDKKQKKDKKEKTKKDKKKKKEEEEDKEEREENVVKQKQKQSTSIFDEYKNPIDKSKQIYKVNLSSDSDSDSILNCDLTHQTARRDGYSSQSSDLSPIKP